MGNDAFAQEDIYMLKAIIKFFKSESVSSKSVIVSVPVIYDEGYYDTPAYIRFRK